MSAPPVSAPHVGHQHGLSPAADRRRVLTALALVALFMMAEVVVAIAAHSLALLSDAGHMVTDVGALAMSLMAMRLAARPPQAGLTYGLKRAEILSALLNGITLVVFAALIIYEAARRLAAPLPVAGAYVLATALAGVLVNVAVLWLLASAQRRSLNLTGSVRHVAGDLAAYGGTAAGALVIIATGFSRADSLISLGVALLMLAAAYGLIRDAARVLLEAAPAGMNTDEISAALASHPLVVNVHDFHLWEITTGMPALSAHVLVQPERDCHAVRRDLERTLWERFHIDHTTLQVDHAPGERLIQVAERVQRG